MRIIELTGPTGSGKTTIVPILKKVGTRCGIKIFSRHEALLESVKNSFFLFRILSLFPHPVAVFTAKKIYHVFFKEKFKLKFISKNKALFDEIKYFQLKRKIKKNHIDLVLEWFLSFAAHFEFFEKNLSAAQSVVFDEGFVQKVASFFVSEKETAKNTDIERYLNLIPEIFLIINVNAKLHLCKNRILKRGLTPRLQNLTDKEIIAFIHNSIRAINKATNYLALKKVPITSINNNDDLKDVENQILSAFSGMFKKPK